MLQFVLRAPITTLFIVVLCSVFILEVEFAITPWKAALRADISTLLAMGGASAQTLKDISFTRLISTVFLHTDLVHLSINLVAFAIAGRIVEQHFGKLSLLPLITLTAIAASWTSILINPPYIIGVGASGVIMGLLTFSVVLFSIHPDYKNHKHKKLILLQSLWIILPSLLPLTRAGSMLTDYAAHVGGCLGGLFLGIILAAFSAVRTLNSFKKSILQAATLVSLVVLLYTCYRAVCDYKLFTIIFNGY